MSAGRKSDGKFARGTSGNVRGRPPKRRIDPKVPAGRRDVIMRVADRMVDVKVDARGTVERMSLYEANVYQMAVSGAQGNRVAGQRFIELAMATSEQDLLMRVQTRAMIDRMNEVEDTLYELKKTTGRQSGVTIATPEVLAEYSGRRFDDQSAEEILEFYRTAEAAGMAARSETKQDRSGVSVGPGSGG